MDERVLGAAGSGTSAGRRRRLRAMIRGYRMQRWAGLVSCLAIAALLWVPTHSPALAQAAVMSGSRYSAPLGAWIAAIVVTVGLCAVGLAIGIWFLRKRSRLESRE